MLTNEDSRLSVMCGLVMRKQQNGVGSRDTVWKNRFVVAVIVAAKHSVSHCGAHSMVLVYGLQSFSL